MLTPWNEIMTNLDRILKSRNITLPTKARLVKAMVFPVVMYGGKSWTIMKAERQRIDAFVDRRASGLQSVGLQRVEHDSATEQRCSL